MDVDQRIRDKNTLNALKQAAEKARQDTARREVIEAKERLEKELRVTEKMLKRRVTI